MAGKIKKMIDTIIEKKSNGDPILKKTTRLKLARKGIDVDKYTATSEDDAEILTKLRQIANEFKINLD